jgi:hypothetical protein
MYKVGRQISIKISYEVSGSDTKVSLSYHLSVECFSQLSFDSEVYTKSATGVQNQQQLLILYTLLNQMSVVKNI